MFPSDAPYVTNGPSLSHSWYVACCQVPFFILPALGGVGVFVAVYVLAKYYEVRFICMPHVREGYYKRQTSLFDSQPLLPVDKSNLPYPATATVHHPRIHRGLRDPSTVRSGTVGYHVRHSFFKLG